MELKKKWVELVAIIFYIKAIPILYSKIKKQGKSQLNYLISTNTKIKRHDNDMNPTLT